MSFDPINAPIDYCLLAGRKSPGICEVFDANSPRKWDIRKGYALAGARPVFRGNDCAKPAIRIRLYTSQDWQDWHAWKDIVQRPPSLTRPRAIDVWHPIFEDQGITSVVVEDVSQPVQTADGEWTITIKVIEYRRFLQALAAPTASQARPVDPVDQYIERLASQVQELAAQ